MNFSEDSVKKIFGQRASQYTTSSAHLDPVVFAKMCQMVQPQSTWNVLDLATGTGHTAFAFAPYVKHIIGLDITLEMLNEAEKLKQTYSFTNVDFQIGNVHQLPFKDQEFDLITCRRAAHHFTQIKIALKEMNRVLKSSGILAIDDRISPENDFIDKCINELDTLHDASHFREYRQSEWVKMLIEAGFQVIQTETYTKHRPISSLTTNVEPENVKKIMQILDSLNPDQQQLLNFKKIKDELYSNHWFFIITAKKYLR